MKFLKKYYIYAIELILGNIIFNIVYATIKTLTFYEIGATNESFIANMISSFSETFIIYIVFYIISVVLQIKATHNEDYLYNQDGTVVDGKKDLIESIKKMENTEERKNKIDFSVEHNILTQQEANELY